MTQELKLVVAAALFFSIALAHELIQGNWWNTGLFVWNVAMIFWLWRTEKGSPSKRAPKHRNQS